MVSSITNTNIVHMACGQPIDETVAFQAAQWLTLLQSGNFTVQDRKQWEQWRSAHPDHERAWQHIETVTQRIKELQPHAAYQALSTANARKASKRKTLNLLLFTPAVGVSALLASRTQTWQRQAADYRTNTGEQRTEILDDGTQIMLNTATAINLQFDKNSRVIKLIAGDVAITTGHDGSGNPESRPFIVETAEGRILALGTQFSVQQQLKKTRVSVQKSAVAITPAISGEPFIMHAGWTVAFTRAEVQTPLPVTQQDDAWIRNQIVAEDMRLDEFLNELNRYRPGILRCDPEIAALRLSGVFPLTDTDRILNTLPSVVPVKVVMRTRYWVTVQAAS